MDGNNTALIPNNISDTKQKLSDIFLGCSDFFSRDLEVYDNKNSLIKLSIFFIEDLINADFLNRDVITPLLNSDLQSEKNLLSEIKKNIHTSQVKEETDLNKVADSLLNGNVVLFEDGGNNALIIKVSEPEGRAIGKPDTEITLRGSREGFVEKALTNISLIRRRLRNPNFKVESMQLGSQTKTSIYICYINGLVSNEILETIRRRLNKIDTDAILESGYIEQFIEDAPYSIFPTLGNSEKPDKVAAKLLEGRIAIVCDGTPFVLTAPYLLIEAIQAGEDYYEKFPFTTFIRMLRLMALFITSWLPAIYVSLLSYNHSIIPFKLLLTISASREGIPFSPFTEALLMIITFELLREAGIRLPRPLGQTIGIIGAIVLGEAAVKAGIASSSMIIIVSLTAVAGFISPPLIRVSAMARLLMLVAANILGLLGIVVVFVAIFIHLCTIRSFGVPYLSPISPLNVTDLKDTIVRYPLWSLVTRPRVLVWDNKNNRYRMKKDKIKKED